MKFADEKLLKRLRDVTREQLLRMNDQELAELESDKTESRTKPNINAEK